MHTYNSLLQLVAAMTMKPVSTAPTVPKAVAQMFASVVNRALWWPTVSPDEIERRYIDDVGVDAYNAPTADLSPAGWKEASSLGKVSGPDGEAIKTFAELDMTPDFIEEHAIKFLRRYRASYVFFVLFIVADPC